MKILTGFSEDTSQNKWAKGEVEVTEDDLALILAEVELPPEAASKLSAREKFQLMNALAETCLLEQRVLRSIESAEHVSGRIKSFAQIKKQILEKLKASYAPF